MRNILKHRKRRVLAAAGTLGLCAALAFAAWLTEGTGPGRGKVAQLQALTVEAGLAAPASECMPGGSCDATFRITNPNGPLTITSVQDSVGDPFVALGPNPGCSLLSPARLSLSPKFNLSIPLPSGASDVTVQDLFTLDSGAENECQGLEFTKNVRVIASTP
jgi:hypothetical protein